MPKLTPERPPSLAIDEATLLALAEIVHPIPPDIMAAIYQRLAPGDTDTAASLYAIAVGGLMFGDLVRSLSASIGAVEGTINDLWRQIGLPMQIKIEGMQ